MGGGLAYLRQTVCEGGGKGEGEVTVSTCTTSISHSGTDERAYRLES